jgi:hypothetical protein
MAIKKKKERFEKRVIDLNGPQGNAFFLLGMAEKWGLQMGLDTDEIKEEMTSGDYENLIQVFDSYFGSICDLER